eukprot:403358141
MRMIYKKIYESRVLDKMLDEEIQLQREQQQILQEQVEQNHLHVQNSEPFKIAIFKSSDAFKRYNTVEKSNSLYEPSNFYITDSVEQLPQRNFERADTRYLLTTNRRSLSQHNGMPSVLSSIYPADFQIASQNAMRRNEEINMGIYGSELQSHVNILNAFDSPGDKTKSHSLIPQNQDRIPSQFQPPIKLPTLNKDQSSDKSELENEVKIMKKPPPQIMLSLQDQTPKAKRRKSYNERDINLPLLKSMDHQEMGNFLQISNQNFSNKQHLVFSHRLPMIDSERTKHFQIQEQNSYNEQTNLEIKSNNEREDRIEKQANDEQDLVISPQSGKQVDFD